MTNTIHKETRVQD